MLAPIRILALTANKNNINDKQRNTQNMKKPLTGAFFLTDF
jgi:hypothetical protein